MSDAPRQLLQLFQTSRAGDMVLAALIDRAIAAKREVVLTEGLARCGFSGTREDDDGRRFHYRDGRQVRAVDLAGDFTGGL